MSLFLFFSYVSALFALEAIERARFIADRCRKSNVCLSGGQYQQVSTRSIEESPSEAKAYLACVLANLYGTLWVFSTVFGKTLSTYMVHVGVTDSFSQYIISLLLLFVIVIPGSLLDFKDQISVQVILTLFRVVMVIIMMAYVFRHSIPGLSHMMVAKEEKACMSAVFAIALTVSFLAYTALAVSVSLYFDVNTLSPSNLNWVPYR
eukprot:gene35718-46340_t